MGLTCKSSTSWEFCAWRHRNGLTSERVCRLEWKRAHGGVVLQECEGSLAHKIIISGDYDQNECRITISSTTPQDSGTWECEVSIFMIFIHPLMGFGEKSNTVI